MERTIHISLDMTPDEVIKLFREGDRFEPDPSAIDERTLVSDYRNYVFEIERYDGTICTQEIEKYPYTFYLIRDPHTNQYFTFDSLVEWLLSKR